MATFSFLIMQSLNAMITLTTTITIIENNTTRYQILTRGVSALFAIILVAACLLELLIGRAGRACPTKELRPDADATDPLLKAAEDSTELVIIAEEAILADCGADTEIYGGLFGSLLIS
jgi:hypothetical protein